MPGGTSLKTKMETHPQKFSKFGLEPFIPHPCTTCVLTRILRFTNKIHDFVKLQGDVQKCVKKAVLAHRVRDAYVFIAKTMGGAPPHARPSPYGHRRSASLQDTASDAQVAHSCVMEPTSSLRIISPYERVVI